MRRLVVAGAGAFGTALALALLRGGAQVTLWARDPVQADDMARMRRNERRLPGVPLPPELELTADPAEMAQADAVLLAVPMQQLAGFLETHRTHLRHRPLVTCAKGMDRHTLLGPAETAANTLAGATVAVLTGPSFAADIARGLPTALTLACADRMAGLRLQHDLATPGLRLYLSTDVVGAELGGALKNVIAIAAGIAIGAGLGDSARAALMTRGYAEMLRLALTLGARAETLAGLSGFGDMVLTCTSEKSRNFRYGRALGHSESFDASTTVEGAATARAVVTMGARQGVEMPISAVVAAIIDRELTIAQATEKLLARPLKEE